MVFVILERGGGEVVFSRLSEPPQCYSILPIVISINIAIITLIKIVPEIDACHIPDPGSYPKSTLIHIQPDNSIS
jgi:hypothetical protein